MAQEEREIENLLAQMKVEQTIKDWWPSAHPQRIADIINFRHNISWMTEKWVCSIKARLDRMARAAAKE